MSLYPCDSCKRRVSGALEGARITVLSGQARHTRKLRLCAEHLREVLAARGSEWETISDEGPTADQELCSSPECLDAGRTAVASLFAWVWRRGQLPEERYARYCDACAFTLIAAFDLKQEDFGSLPA